MCCAVGGFIETMAVMFERLSWVPPAHTQDGIHGPGCSCSTQSCVQASLADLLPPAPPQATTCCSPRTPTSADAAHLPAATRKLPGGLPLKSVKLIACQLFKVEPTKQQLLYNPPGMDNDIPEPLEDESKSLADLGVVSGGTIVIDDKEL